MPATNTSKDDTKDTYDILIKAKEVYRDLKDCLMTHPSEQARLACLPELDNLVMMLNMGRLGLRSNTAGLAAESNFPDLNKFSLLRFYIEKGTKANIEDTIISIDRDFFGYDQLGMSKDSGFYNSLEEYLKKQESLVKNP